MSSFDKNYDSSNMRRYWTILSSLNADAMNDSEKLHIQITQLRDTLEKEIQKLMKKGVSIPNL